MALKMALGVHPSEENEGSNYDLYINLCKDHNTGHSIHLGMDSRNHKIDDHDKALNICSLFYEAFVYIINADKKINTELCF